MQSDVNATPPSVTLLRMITGSWLAQAVYVAAKLGIADLLHDGPQRCDALAEATGAHAPSLFRVLRALASFEIFQDEDGLFRTTPLAECLETGKAGSMRDFAIMAGEEWIWRSWGEIMHSVKTGEPAFEHVFNAPVFEYYGNHPEAGRVSAQGLASRSAQENAAIVSAYDFSDATTVVDVAGGFGTLLASILDANPNTRGLLFDMPHVIEMAKPLFEKTAQRERCDLAAGDFFVSLPAAKDVYILKKVIHDWDDERATSILKNCRAAIPDTGRLLLIELVVPPGNEPSFSKLLDLLMLVFPGGKERTQDEHRALLTAARFEIKRIIRTASNVSIIEALPR